MKQSDSTIDYGPYDDIDAFTKDDKLVVHYEHNGPFLTVIRMERVIEVSHWGNIAVEETYHMRHTGAILKGIHVFTGMSVYWPVVANVGLLL